MPKPAVPALHAPLALCALFALGACLDNSMPVTPGTGTDTEIGRSDDRVVPKDTGKGPVPFESLSIRERFDSSYAAFRALKARSFDAYRYVVSDPTPMGWNDSTIVSWSAGRAKSREVWYTDWTSDNLHLMATRKNFLEEAGRVGARSEGHPALSLDSLYELCRRNLPDDTGRMKWFSLDSDRILRQCGSYGKTSICTDECGPQVDLDRVEWFVSRPLPEPVCIYPALPIEQVIQAAY